jgi:hypothetical protein
MKDLNKNDRRKKQEFRDMRTKRVRYFRRKKNRFVIVFFEFLHILNNELTQFTKGNATIFSLNFQPANESE